MALVVPGRGGRKAARGEKREKGQEGWDGYRRRLSAGGYDPRIRFRVPVALMTAILPPLAPLTLPCPTIAPLPSSHHRESHPPLRGDAPCLSPSLSLTPSSFSTLYAIHIQDDSNYVTTLRERATRSPPFPFPPSHPYSLPERYRFTSTDPTPPRFPSCFAAGYTVYTRYM